MPQTYAMRVADEAHRYVTSLNMWQVEHTDATWAMWKAQHDLSENFASHVARVINEIFKED